MKSSTVSDAAGGARPKVGRITFVIGGLSHTGTEHAAKVGLCFLGACNVPWCQPAKIGFTIGPNLSAEHHSRPHNKRTSPSLGGGGRNAQVIAFRRERAGGSTAQVRFTLDSHVASHTVGPWERPEKE